MSLRVGLLINPIAGIGGQGGFKGSDADWKDALDAGFEPVAPARAQRFVDGVEGVTWLCGPGAMGLPGLPCLEGGAVLGQTTGDDTRRIAKELANHVDLLCFVGGDGTATDIAAAIGDGLPCLGIPGGVKITSPVFAHDPDEAAWLVSHLQPGFETTVRDVTDLDEVAYKAGRVETKLTGSLRVPLSPAIQGGKAATTTETPLEPLVDQVMEDWDRDAAYLVGAGSVCKAIKAQFWGQPTLLGVDALLGDRIVETDLNGPAIEAFVAAQQAEGRQVRILLSTIGGQGMLLGRGTQVFTPNALASVGWSNIWVVAPPEKLIGLKGLHVDSGDPSFDAEAPKHIRVTAGWHETRMVRVLHGPSG
ncbi:MAG: ATP-NAD kinase family protein [Thermoplasmatota archaeon]